MNLYKNCTERGFTLIEILVTVFVLAIGLLGFAALQTEGIKHNRAADVRSEAMQATYNIADKIRANVKGAIAGDYVAAATPSAAYDCNTTFGGGGKCSPSEMATADLDEWYTALDTDLPFQSASISCADTNVGDSDACTRGSIHTIQVSWQEQDNTESSGFVTKTLSLDLQP